VAGGRAAGCPDAERIVCLTDDNAIDDHDHSHNHSNNDRRFVKRQNLMKKKFSFKFSKK
jgi:hypothetical protein